jgi:hypothetical protein
MNKRGPDIGIPSIPMGGVERKRSRGEMYRKAPTPEHGAITTHTFAYSSNEDLNI